MGSLLMPLLSSVAAKAGDALVGELLRAWGLDSARRKLERHLSAVRYILVDAEAKSRSNPAVREWIEDLKTAAYKADDVLDDFRYEALRRAAKIRGSTSRKVLTYFTVNSPVIFRLSMSRKMKDVLENIDELVAEMNKFHFLEHTETPSIVHPQTHSRVDESDIVGKQDEKEEVVKILLENQSNNHNVMVLPIVGMGGIGKTTLAQLVHNDHRVVHHFELVIWVCVSDQFAIKEIIRSIIEVATMKKCDLSEMETVQKELSRVLGKKRYLLVLDDVWNEDRQKWEGLRSLLCSDAGSGSAIIVTSRSDQVASIMGTIPSHQISLLNEDQSWELFRKDAFGSEVENQDELVLMARNIVQKLNGLPLAIKTMAALLRSKHQDEWFSVLESDVWKNDILTTGILPVLQLSCDHLSSEAKICFSFCSVFPKDSLMDKDILIQLWLANDFIASETRGEQIFDELSWRCFLQDIKTQDILVSKYEDLAMHRPITCKMHDLMHDLAESVSGTDCSILQKSPPQKILQGSTNARHNVRHLSLVSVNDTSASMKEILAPRTILVRRKMSPQPLIMSKSKFMSVRALNTLPKIDMTHLKHLRYLDCSYSHIDALPEATAMLYSLQTLKLIGCQYLKKLPEGMRLMRSLRHVFLVGCLRLKHMPEGIGQLTCLQTLTNYVTDSRAGRGIDQLKDLNLGGALSLFELRKVHSAENANMSTKHNLKRLSLDWYHGPSRTDPGDEVHNAEGILEALCPPKRLEVLLLANYTGARFSSWMYNSTLLEHLSELSLRSCKSCKALPPLWQLPSLGYLRLDSMDSLTSICISNYTSNGISPPSFLKLETMIVSRMPKLERWYQEVAGQVAVVSLPQLKKLNISQCPRLASMPKMVPLLEDILVDGDIKSSLSHMFNLSVQSNLGCRGSIKVEHARWRSRLHFSRHCDSDMSLEFEHLTENSERIEEELERIPCTFIKKVKIVDCNCLFSSGELPQIQQRIWNHFGFVKALWIINCSSIVATGFENMICLRKLILSRCSNLTGLLPSVHYEEHVLHPQLQVLVIEYCENLVEVPELPASLEILDMDHCHKLLSVPTILGDGKELRELLLSHCNALTTFSDGMYGLTKLNKLCISYCPKVETLPEGLLQQLPTLEVLSITCCPNLERAFSRGGAYWSLIDANQHKNISAEYGYRFGRYKRVAALDAGRAMHDIQHNPVFLCLVCCLACLLCALPDLEFTPLPPPAIDLVAEGLPEAEW